MTYALGLRDLGVEVRVRVRLVLWSGWGFRVKVSVRIRLKKIILQGKNIIQILLVDGKKF
jgi:hypothetical protein